MSDESVKIKRSKSNNKQKALEILQKEYASFYSSEGLSVGNRNLSFWTKGNFQREFNSIANDAKESKRVWRTHIYSWAFGNGLSIEGDLIECGVYKGFSSAVACRFFNFENSDKELILIDNFHGIPENQLDKTRRKLSEDGVLDHYNNPEVFQICKNRFSKYKNVRIIKGTVPQVFSEYKMPEKISFLHLDMNTSIAEIAALELFYERMTKGSVCLLDDFGWLIAKDQMLAELDWLNSKGINFCELPTGQALFIKN